MFYQNNLNFFLNNHYFGYSILYMSIYTYIFLLYLFFSLLFLFDLKKIKTISSLKIFYKHSFLSTTIVLVFLSMSGIPPLAGFVGKFLIFNFLFLTQKYIYVIFFSILNFFSIYFYIQNLRFLVSKTQHNFFIVNCYYVFFNKNLINLLVLLNFWNYFGILYFEDALYFFIFILTFKTIF